MRSASFGLDIHLVSDIIILLHNDVSRKPISIDEHLNGQSVQHLTPVSKYWYKQRFVGFNSRERSFQSLAQSKSWQQKACLGQGVQQTFLDTDYFHKNFGMKKVWRTDSQELTLYQEWPVGNFPCHHRRILELGRTSIQEATGLRKIPLRQI